MGGFTNYALDRYLAPEVSRFTSAEIPDTSDYDPESASWLASHFRYTVLRGHFAPPVDALAFNYLRRAEGAFSEHANARLATLDFLARDRPSPSLYSAALLHWEFYLAQAWQGYELLRRLPDETRTTPLKVFRPGDGSVVQRLHALYNSMKHVENRITTPGQILEEATVPVWLTNAGLKSTDATLSYEETGEILRDLAKWANLLVDPTTMGEKAKQYVV